MVEAYVAYPSKPKNVTGPIRYFRFDVFLGETMSSDGDPSSSFADTLPLLFIFRMNVVGVATHLTAQNKKMYM